MFSELINNRFILEICLKIIKTLKKIKIKKIFKLFDNMIERKGRNINDNIDAKDEYFLTRAIVIQHNMKKIPKE